MLTPVSISPKPWLDRRFTICSLPGGTESQAFMLRGLLSKLPCAAGSTISWKNSSGKEISAGSEDRCIHELAALGLVLRNPKGQWIPSPIAGRWLSEEDPFLLASHLHANVKFFGELLTAIGPESTQADLLDVAKNTYGLNWTSLDPVRRRTSWLRSIGMVELWGQKVVRTSSGDQLLDQLELCLPDEARGLPI